QGVFGTFLRALFGYNASPDGLQLLTWALYLAIFVTLWQRSYRPQVSAASSKGRARRPSGNKDTGSQH
ncbi:hypothetical protein ACKC4X_21765, partial [Aeromonas veronii]